MIFAFGRLSIDVRIVLAFVLSLFSSDADADEKDRLLGSWNQTTMLVDRKDPQAVEMLKRHRLHVLHVSSDGHDIDAGSGASFYRTIQSAVDDAEPGTAILVKGGEYRENVVFRSSGTDEAPIWLISADGRGEAKIRPVDENQATILGRGVENLVIQGFEIDGADNRNGIEFTQSGHDFTKLVRNIVIEGNDIRNVGIDGIKIAQAEGVEIVGNLIVGGREEGIDLVTVWNSRIAHNEVRDVDGRAGIVAKGGSNHVIIENNYVHDIAVDGIIVGGWTDAELFHLFKGYEANEVTVRGNYVQGVEKRALNFLAAQNSTATDNVLDPDNDYFTVINIEGDNLGYVSKNLTIVDNLITKPNWLHVANGHDQGHQISNNKLGSAKPINVGVDNYSPSVIVPSEQDDALAEPIEVPSDVSSDLITSAALDRAFDNLGDAIIVEHDDQWQLDSGSIQFAFTTEDASKVQGIVSKDAAYFGEGGHLTAWVDDEKLIIRLQDRTDSHYVETAAGSIQNGVEHHVTLSFGDDGMALYLDGELADVNDHDGGIAGNAEPWVIGARSIYSDAESANKLSDPFSGTINNMVIRSELDISNSLEAGLLDGAFEG